MNKPNLGFIGIGIMGAPMAANLARAGYNLTLFDVNYQACHDAAASFSNMKVAESPKEVARVSDIVITMLPSGRYVQESVFGDTGMIEGFREGALLIDTSSSEPWLTVETADALKDKGIEMVDAPVSGAQPGAQAARLVFMIGGQQEAVDQAMPILHAMGNQFHHLGPVGSGHTMKCINNLITSVTFMATIEGLSIGKHYGLDPNVMTDVLNVSTGMSWISRTHIKQRIISRKFDDQFKLALMVKDIGIATAMANETDIPVPCSALAHQLWRAADRYAGEGSSISEMARWVEHVTGIEITDK